MAECWRDNQLALATIAPELSSLHAGMRGRSGTLLPQTPTLSSSRTHEPRDGSGLSSDWWDIFFAVVASPVCPRPGLDDRASGEALLLVLGDDGHLDIPGS